MLKVKVVSEMMVGSVMLKCGSTALFESVRIRRVVSLVLGLVEIS